MSQLYLIQFLLEPIKGCTPGYSIQSFTKEGENLFVTFENYILYKVIDKDVFSGAYATASDLMPFISELLTVDHGVVSSSFCNYLIVSLLVTKNVANKIKARMKGRIEMQIIEKSEKIKTDIIYTEDLGHNYYVVCGTLKPEIETVPKGLCFDDYKNLKVKCLGWFNSKPYIGVAKCNNEDKFDLELGKKIAKIRCDDLILEARKKQLQIRHREYRVAAVKAEKALLSYNKLSERTKQLAEDNTERRLSICDKLF